MKIKITLRAVIAFLGLLTPCAGTYAQLTVSTTPQNKNFLIERGTGIACGSCPTKELECQAIINTYPAEKGLLIQYHFGPDAKPQSGQLNKDYRTQFGDSILTPVWPFYLNMMVNRRDKGNGNSTFIIGSTDQVTPECASVAAQVSPVNLAMSSTYNSLTREITVTAMAYYTANSATANNYLQIAITEDSVIGPQVGVGGSSTFIYNFPHMNMFRANMNGPKGAIITTTTAGTTVTRTFTYTVPAKYGTGASSGWVTPNPSHFKLNMFMTEAPNASGTQSFTGKIITIIRTPLGGTTAATGVVENNSMSSLSVYPNPSTGVVHLNISEAGSFSYQVIDVLGKNIMSRSILGGTEEIIDLSGRQKGIYFIKVSSENGLISKKIMLID